MGWIDSEAELSLVKQCELAGISRATWYSRQITKPANDDDLQVCRLIDEEYTRRPFYGSRPMVLVLKDCGLIVNRKRVQRLMATMGLAGMAPGPNTSKMHPQHKVYPYLLRGMQVVRPNQVWSTDITYGRLARGFVYLVACIPDYFSDARGESPMSLRSPGDSPQEQTGQRCSAAIEEMGLA